MVTNWLSHQLVPLKKQVHPGWEYCGVKDPTHESSENIKLAKLKDLLKELFLNTKSWPTPEQVCAFHIQRARDPIKHF
jgi:hypothetical protein